MLTENNIIKNNIFKFRRLLTESVGKSLIINAIKNMEYLYLYYDGDDLTSTGYRIIKPYICGINGKGNEVLRAWQIEGDSDSFKGKLNKWKGFHKGVRRVGHEFRPDAEIRDTKGKPKKKDIPGWRMFNLDKIKSVYPTGNTFKTEPLPPDYKGKNERPSDRHPFNIVSIFAAVPVDYKEKPIEKEPEKIDVADKYLKDPNLKTHIQTWFDQVKKIKKRSPSNIIIYINDRGYPDFSIGYGAIKKYNIPDDRIIGNLQRLYDEYVLPEKARRDTWLKEKKRNALKDIRK